MIQLSFLAVGALFSTSILAFLLIFFCWLNASTSSPINWKLFRYEINGFFFLGAFIFVWCLASLTLYVAYT